METLELNEKVIELLLNAIDMYEGSEFTSVSDDLLCKGLEDELETKLCNIQMKRGT